MKLKDLIEKIDCKVVGKIRGDIQHLSHLAQECHEKSIYFCLNSEPCDATKWANIAIDNGCKTIVCENTVVTNKKIVQIVVPNARQAMSQIASLFYGEPSKKLQIIGVTGTNGKTTTTTMIAHVLKSKYTVGLIGTNGVVYADKKIDTGFTTPDPIAMHKIFADMVNSGVSYVVIEYSAHAIYLQKLWGITSHIVAFTNLSQDHLDFFENMQKYYSAKEQLFKDCLYNYSVVCTDDEYGKKLSAVSKNCVTCSSNSNNADIFIENKEHTTISQKFSVMSKNGSAKISMKLLGSFNLQNAVVAISVCLKCGLTFDEIAQAIETFNGVDGRFECYNNGVNTVIIDYAHTPDGLANVLKTAKTIAGKNKLISVFGCGGNRDSAKRSLMGAVSQKYADFTIVTTDNPRFEDNYQIAQDIIKGFSNNKYKMLLDRGQALREALNMCKSGDIVLLAGKGAENYIDIMGTKVDWSDKNLVEQVLKGK